MAWLLAAALSHRRLNWRRNLVGGPAQYISIVEFSRPGMVRRSWHAGLVGDTGLWSDLHNDATIKLHNPTVNQDRSWGDLPADLAHPTKNSQGAEDARGWPFLCLWNTIDEQVIEGMAAGRPIRGGIQCSRLTGSTTVGTIRALPLCPIWRGLFADAAVYAATWAVVIPGGRSMRAAIRRRRGCCPRCGYNLKGELSRGCSECGWNRESTAAT